MIGGWSLEKHGRWTRGGDGKQCSAEKYSLDLVHHGSVDGCHGGHPGLFVCGEGLLGPAGVHPLGGGNDEARG